MRPHDPAFDVPDLSDVANLTLGRLSQAGTLKPTDIVVCVNRGRKTLTETCDGNHVDIPAGHFLMEYGPAQHFQRKLVVPGTRDLEVGGHVSWLGILGSEDGRIPVDDPADCEPFTDAQLQAFGERIEAIDRSAMSNAVDRDVQVIAGAGPTRGRSGRLRPQIETGQQASELAREASAHVFEPSDEPNLARQAEVEARADGVTVGDAGGDDVPQPRAMRRAIRR